MILVTAIQPPTEKRLPDPMSEWIKSGKWRGGYEASDQMLDEHAKRYGLEDLARRILGIDFNET